MSAKFWKLGIIGWPLVKEYSLSPRMHKAVLDDAGWKGDYEAIPVKLEELGDWLTEKAPCLDGFNVTMPHKQAVYQWLKRHGRIFNPGVVDLIGAVNTVKVERMEDRGEQSRLVGFNTDGSGFFRSLSAKLDPAGKQVFLLGAGGAAQAIAVYLAVAGHIRSLKIWNRHSERAVELANKVNGLGGPCSASVVVKTGEISLRGTDLVVNSTPLGMKGSGDIPDEVLAQLDGKQAVYDIVYEPLETKLVRQARGKGCLTITGDEMLVEQGEEAFEIWVGESHTGVIHGRFIKDVMREALSGYFADRS